MESIIRDRKIFNNKTEDSIYYYNGRFVYGGALKEVIEDNHLTKLDVERIVKFEAGKNINESEFSNADLKERYAIALTLKNGATICHSNMTHSIAKSVIELNTHIVTRGAVIFIMSDSIDCSKLASEIYDGMINDKKQEVKQYLSVNEMSELMCVTGTTLRNWDKAGKLKPAVVLEDGRRMYTFEQSLEYFRDKKKIQGKGIGYVIKEQKQEESERAIKNFFKTEEVSDYDIIEDTEEPIENREMLKIIIRRILRGGVSHFVVVAENNAINIQNLELFKIMLENCGCKLRIVYMSK